MDKESRTSPFAAALLGGLVASVATLSAVYLANQENRKRIAFRFDELRKSLDAKTLESRSGVSQQLRTLAEKVEASEEGKGKTKKK